MPNASRLTRLIPVAAIALLAGAACSSPGTNITFDDGPGFNIDPQTITLRTGDTATVVVTVRAPATTPVRYEWTSEDRKIADVQSIAGVGERILALGVGPGKTNLDVTIRVGTLTPMTGKVGVIVSPRGAGVRGADVRTAP